MTQKRKKMAFFTQNEAPFRMKYLDELAKYIDIDIFHIGEYESELNQQYISYHTKKAKTKDVHRSFFRRRIFDNRKFSVSKYNIVILDGYGFFAQQLLAFSLIIHKVNYILSIDGGFIRKESWFKYLFKKIILTHAQNILSTGEATDKFAMYYGVRKDKIVRHIFSNVQESDVLIKPLNNYEKAELKNKLGLKNKFTLISVGKTPYIKGFDILEKIGDIVSDFDYQILIVGTEGVHAPQNEKIVYIPFLNREELNSYYKAADIFILLTRHDVWGLVIGEAMSMGLPVVTTDMCLAGLEMVVSGQNGYIVKSEDVDTVITSIRKLYDSDLYSYGQKSIEIAKNILLRILQNLTVCFLIRLNK